MRLLRSSLFASLVHLFIFQENNGMRHDISVTIRFVTRLTEYKGGLNLSGLKWSDLHCQATDA